MMWRWAGRDRKAVIAEENGIVHCRSINDPEITAWLLAGNIPDDEEVKVLPPHAVSVQTIEGMLYTWYRFERVGDELAWHNHPFSHYSVLLRGKIKTEIENGPERIMAEPIRDSILFPAGPRHRLEALEPDSMCLQIQIGN